ncbi:GDSL lipase/esterase [Cunninghamella echinulata]|nr:GDSL lipase/esterase [Cunninghamella echinulata]
MKTFFSFGDSYTTHYLNLDTLTYPDPNEVSSTNGYNWVNYFTKNNNLTSWDLAYNSAPIENDLVHQDPKVIDLNQQITEIFPNYFLKNQKWASDETLYGMWIGINDIGLMATRNDTASLYELMNKYQELIAYLYKNNARNFIVINIPPIEHSPKWSNEKTFDDIRKLVKGFNQKLSVLVRFLRVVKGYNIKLIDSYEILTDVIDHPAKYNIKDVKNTCPDWKHPEEHGCLPINEYFWFNNVHLTSRVHEIIADKIKAELSQ